MGSAEAVSSRGRFGVAASPGILKMSISAPAEGLVLDVPRVP